MTESEIDDTLIDEDLDVEEQDVEVAPAPVENLRFMYFRDPKCEHRVVTLAREVEDDKMYITWCVNKVFHEEYRTLHKDEKTNIYITRTEVYDAFSKRTARKICRGRMAIGKAVVLTLDMSSSAPMVQQMIDAIGVDNCKPTLSWMEPEHEQYDEVILNDRETARVPRLAVPPIVARVVRDNRAAFIAARTTNSTRTRTVTPVKLTA